MSDAASGFNMRHAALVTLTDAPSTSAEDAVATAVFLDLDSCLLAAHPGRRGVELGLQGDVAENVERLAQIAEHVVVVVDPTPQEGGHGLETARRLQVLRDGLGDRFDDLIVVACPHGEHGTCDCSKPDHGLIELAIREHRLPRRGGWHIGGDQEGVQAGRSAGLRTIRIGPVGEDHLSNVHRADYEARDLLDASNRIMLESLSVT